MKLAEATVLVVDDELELLEIFAVWLGRSGCRVLTAPNGARALEILAAERVDALISDIQMPILDGVSLVRRIFDLRLSIPSIIFVSGFGEVEPREMHALGVEAMLEKPLSRQLLLRALEESLLEREDLWLTPPAVPADQALSLAFDSLEDAQRTLDFELGRGGCCFACTQALAEERTLALTVTFARENLMLEAHCDVRWYKQACVHAGVAFRYLNPECRDWILALMERTAPRSFIPRC